MSKPRKFRLRKDLIGTPAGTIYTDDGDGEYSTRDDVLFSVLEKEAIEDKDWFEELVDKTAEEVKNELIDFYNLRKTEHANTELYTESARFDGMTKGIKELWEMLEKSGFKIVKESEYKELQEQFNLLLYNRFNNLENEGGVSNKIDEPTQTKQRMED